MTVPLRARFALLAATLVLLVASLVGVAGYLAFESSVLDRARNSARSEVVRMVGLVGLGGAGEGQSVDLSDSSLTRQLATPGLLVEVARPSGALVQAAPTKPRGQTIALPAAARTRCLASGQAQIRLSQPQLEVACGRVGRAGAPLGMIVVGVPLHDSLASLTDLRRVLIVGVLGGGLLAAVLALLLARRALRPLRRTAQTAEGIRSGDLSRRIGYRGNDELGEVTGVLDACFAELEQAIERQRQFAADASHELKTPLAAVRANAELLRNWAAVDPAARERALVSLEQATVRASHLVADLLQLVRLDRSPSRTYGPVRLDQTTLDAVREATPLRREVAIRIDQLADVTVNGDPIGLQQLLLNLLDNALRVSPPGSEVMVGLTTDDELARVTVTDTGPGIDPSKTERIFDRFYTSQRGGGAGLGLAIAQSIAKTHGGELVAVNNRGAGATFVLTLPRQLEQASPTTRAPHARDRPVDPRTTDRGAVRQG